LIDFAIWVLLFLPFSYQILLLHMAVALGWGYVGSVQIAGAEVSALFGGVWLVWICFCIVFHIWALFFCFVCD
jgi:hypothetical protein